jgi:hypothetical protein
LTVWLGAACINWDCSITKFLCCYTITDLGSLMETTLHTRGVLYDCTRVRTEAAHS